jgi:hypothetical protein
MRKTSPTQSQRSADDYAARVKEEIEPSEIAASL